MNKHVPHLLILTEDQATGNVAQGFLDNNQVSDLHCRILPPYRGWQNAVDSVKLLQLEKYPQRYLILVIDYDHHFDERIRTIKEEIPSGYGERTFIFGAADEVESLKKLSGVSRSLVDIGKSLADECATGTCKMWKSDELKCNLPEAKRCREAVKDFLFEQ